jgi:hypothetical protein
MVMPFNLKQMAMAAVAAMLFGAGWYVRGLVAFADIADYQASLFKKGQDQRELKAKVEASQAKITDESSDRLDQQAEQTQKEIQYVDREVVKFRDRWRDSACRLPDEWLQLYNASLGTGDAVPGAAETRPPTN